MPLFFGHRRDVSTLAGDPKAIKKVIVIGAVEVRAYELGKKPRKRLLSYGDKLSGRCRLARISANTEKEIKAFMRANIEPGTKVLTDGHESYAWINREALAEIERTGQEVRPEYVHEPHVVRKIAAHLVLPWIHRVFSLMKRWSMGTYHGLRRQHIDAYLNEFVFRYNRRRLRQISFDAILGLSLRTTRPQPTGTSLELRSGRVRTPRCASDPSGAALWPASGSCLPPDRHRKIDEGRSERHNHSVAEPEPNA